MNKTCGTCIFWKRSPVNGKRIGVCKENSPSVKIINPMGMVRGDLEVKTCIGSSCENHCSS